MALCQTSVLKLYHSVIEDVISSVRDAFLDEGVDEQVLQEMKQIWTNKILASRAVEITPDPPEPTPPPIIANNPKSATNKTKAKAAANKNAIAAAGNNENNKDNTGGTPVAQALNGNSKATVNTQPKPQNVQGPTANTNLQQQNMQQQQQSQQQLQVQQQQVPAQQTPSSAIPAVAALDPNKIMPVNITLPAQPGTVNSESRVLTIHVPASALQENQLTQILTANLISSIMSLPTALASNVLQQHVNAALQNSAIHKNFNVAKQQLDGAVDTSDEDGSEESDENLDNEEDEDPDRDDDEDNDGEGGAEEEPLNSEDDVTDEDASDLFDTDNVVVCQYDKITRSRNKWKFYLKDGIMNIGGKDYVFQKSNGDAEW
ncbi:transcription initiation factor IIA subunit 1 [Condylostylus longicornis]|uniref:transcription initiation factor IIA subunit 1 n=1 Tax=Condylostylus longicornis TaxID=2530218 RepID=UPI00244DA62D|nr:transcription initiation factor IIA subunit 1 [Condylostylus longicornis]